MENIKDYQSLIELINKNEHPKVLLHSCCGPCSSACIELMKQGLDIDIYYCNPNIDTAIEFEKRAKEQQRIAGILTPNTKVIIDEYDQTLFNEAIKGKEMLGEKSIRCYECYLLRMKRTCKYAKEHGHKGICSESEWKQVERDIDLVRKTGCPYHICHISTKETVELVRKAKAEGLDVTCETGPHYLVLTDEDLQEEGRFKMNPPLRSAEDRAALIEGLCDGTIDMIATDHAPHSKEEKAKGLFELLDEGIIPVVCGFLGRDDNGDVTTLGRGGSDITAFFLGHCLKANEVIIVTDVDGVMSTDPRKISNAIKLDQISVEEMRDLATHGAQVLHPHALRYKDPEIDAKIISFEKECLADPGTAIVGPFEDSSTDVINIYHDPITAVAIVGENLLNQVGLLAKLTNIISEADINIFGISVGHNSITTFLNKSDADEVYPVLHDLVIEEDNLSSISLGGDIGMITVVSPEFIDTPGIVSSITSPLKDNDINIIEISSSQTAVVVFVEWKDSRKAYNLIKEVL